MVKKVLIFALLIAFSVLLGGVLLISRYVLKTPETPDIEIAANVNANQSPTNKPNPTLNAKVEKDTKLQTQADSLLNLFDNMPQVPVLLKDEPVLKTGSEVERGLAYTICEDKTRPTVFIKKVFYQKGNQKQITNILKHELTHAWFCRKGVQVGHGVDFRKKFESIGGFGN